MPWPCVSSWVTLGRLLSFSEPYTLLWRMKARVGVKIHAGYRAGLRTRRSKRASKEERVTEVCVWGGGCAVLYLSGGLVMAVGTRSGSTLGTVGFGLRLR